MFGRPERDFLKQGEREREKRRLPACVCLCLYMGEKEEEAPWSSSGATLRLRHQGRLVGVKAGLLREVRLLVSDRAEQMQLQAQPKAN